MNKILPFILFGIGGVILATQNAEATSPSRISVDEEVVIYAVSTTDGNPGVFTLNASGSNCNPTKISGSTAIGYNFQESGGTFISTETVYGTKNTSYGSVYAIKATAEGGESGPWSYTYMRDKDDNKTYTYEMVASDMAYDAISKKIYGWFKADSYDYNYRLAEYDGEKHTIIPIGQPTSTCITALAFDAQGTLWGIAGHDSGKLYMIDRATGELTEKGQLGITAYGTGQSAAIDASGKMYWGAVMNSFSASLYEVDLETCEAKQVYSFPMGQRYNAFFIPGPATKKGAPAAIENLTAKFNGNDVTVTFTAPSKTFGGADLSGELTYTLTIDGEAPAADGTGKINAGDSFEKTYAMSQGQHIITVGLSNAIGESPKSSAEVYAGFDTPAAVTGITTSVDGSNVTISWNAPAGINGGTLDNSKISYDVVRNPGASVVAEGTKDLSVTDVIPDGFVKTYSYTISVVFDGETGQSATSEALAIGKPYTVPYLQDFESIDNFAEAGISAVAVNGADFTWKHGEIDGNKCAVVDVISGTKHDYALFTAPMTLRAGVNYTLKFKIACSATYASTGMRIFLSKSQSINENDNIYPFIDPNLSFQIFDANDANKFKEQTYSFTAPEDGTYSVGFYETFGNRFDSQSIFIDDIEVTGIFPYPTAATDVTATQLEHGSRTIDVAFTLPSKDVNDKDLESISKVEIYCGNNDLVGSFGQNSDNSPFVPGEKASCRIEEAPRGYQSYKVVVYNGELASAPSINSVAFSGYLNNLKVVDVKSPSEIPYNGKGEVEVTVMNDGFDPIYAYTIDLVEGDRAVDSAEGVALNSDETHTFTLEIYWDSYEPRTRTYGVAAVYEDDNIYDNASTDFNVSFVKDPVGVETCDADGTRITTEDGNLIVSGNAHVEVFSINGNKLAEAEVSGTWRKPLPEGIYLVKTGRSIIKIIL